MDLSIGILFFQESRGILHPPSCMDRPWNLDIEWNSPTYLENSRAQQEDNNEYQLSFQGNSKNGRKFSFQDSAYKWGMRPSHL